MKKLFFNLIILSSLFYSCENDEILETNIDSNLEVHDKNALIRSEDLSNLRFKDVPGSLSLDEATPQGQIRIEASGDLNDRLEVKKEGGELRIIGKNNFPTSLDLNFFIHPNDIRKIVIEGNNIVEIVSTPVLEYLEIVTEGESQLIIHNLKVKNLVSRREGKSRMFLSGLVAESDFDQETLSFSANTAEILEGNYILYSEDGLDYIIFAPEINLEDDFIYAVGNENDPINAYFITHTHELRNEGNSTLDALELPTNIITSKNEGQSESRVWALSQLNVRGEGQSEMYFMGNPDVNQRMEGGSSLIKLP
jgi:hypothetical protein